MNAVSAALFFLSLFHVVFGGNYSMADPENINSSLFDDDHCSFHALQNHSARNTSGCYKQWNERVLTYIPCKECGNMRYFVQVETAPQPTKRSPKPAACVKVKQIKFFTFGNFFFKRNFKFFL